MKTPWSGPLPLTSVCSLVSMGRRSEVTHQHTCLHRHSAVPAARPEGATLHASQIRYLRVHRCVCSLLTQQWSMTINDTEGGRMESHLFCLFHFFPHLLFDSLTICSNRSAHTFTHAWRFRAYMDKLWPIFANLAHCAPNPLLCPAPRLSDVAGRVTKCGGPGRANLQRGARCCR